ncbi:protein PHLOEM PROTEIN 2-LIKE A10-like [Coffea arabica]|uniref:Protein PHLOEM PROTEIN 2-LIKE A10-like n=1 Tax=Coffea arabica TaxID=13443 RepID=A0A6P6TAF0_COFAR|nr:protein PHLOEM PROTEIN 2-LIKE A10-like [Coffea arabica]XP_027074861.1 protein PHLOEM PROTEIN 2-LIKE A10-like [Coffea arabica]
MDLDFLKWAFDYTKKKKKWVLAFGAFYGAYKFYHLPSVVKKRKRLSKLLGALVAVAEMVSDSAEAVGVVSRDLKEFIQSDSDQIPSSLRQISKIARSDEISESLMRITTALTVGILRGNRQEKLRSGGSISPKSDFSDRILDKLFSEAGSGFASVVVGSFARNLVVTYYSNKQLNGSSNADHDIYESNSTAKWVNVLLEDKCREVIGDCVQMFVSTAVTVFLDKTMGINPYDELFSGMTNPKHESKVKEMLSSLCNVAVETLVRSSHQVLADAHSRDAAPDSKYLPSELLLSPSKDQKALIQRKLMSFGSKPSKLSCENEDSGWTRKMSSTLAVPNNRKLVLDVTGRVTFESVRSFLEFLLEKIAERLRSSIDAVHDEVIDRGIEVVQHVSRKSAAASICLCLCLHILSSPWILVPTY